MKVYQLHKGNDEKPEVLLILDKTDAKLFHAVFEEYTKQNKRKKIAKKIFKQMDNEFWIF